MDTELMRAKLKARYPHSLSWAAKVDKMFENQVIAIYLRMAQSGELERTRKAKKPEPRINPDEAKTLYMCNGCGAQFIRDNPELEECEYCGSDYLNSYVIQNQTQQLSFVFGGT